MRPEISRVVELIQRKDQESLAEALSLLQRTVFSFSMKVCGQREDAEDTMQEVLLQSVPSLRKFDSPRALMVWLYKVAKSRCLMSRRKSKFAPKEALSLEELMPNRKEMESLGHSADRTPESLALRRENASRLREAVRQLPPEYRLILVLHDMEDLSDQDIAEITGLRAGTIRVRLHRARLYVRKELARHDTSRLRHPAREAAMKRTEPPRPRRCKEMFAELSDYLDGEMDESLCQELEKHMEGCKPCEAFLSSLQSLIDKCRETPNESPDPALAARMRRELLDHYREVMKQTSRRAAVPPRQR